MTENIEKSNQNVVVVEEQEEEPKSLKMAEGEEQPQQHQAETQNETKKTEKPSITPFSIWPPAQRTRDAVVGRLIETLSTPSVLSKRYGAIPHDEAAEIARRVEDEAFDSAASSSSAADDGIEVLNIYSKEISKRMLDAVKSRSASAPAPDSDDASQSSVVAPGPTVSEEIASVEDS